MKVVNCGNCGKETKNPKYCGKQCAGLVNGAKNSKATPKGKCKDCQTPLAARWTRCPECTEKYKYAIKYLNTTTCLICNVEKTEENARKRKTKEGWMPYCKKCMQELSMLWRRKAKDLCVEYKGGRCENCGYNKCNASLQFHHRDRTQKDFNICKIKRLWLSGEVQRELDKCAILCANCHFEEHFNQRTVDVCVEKYSISYLSKL